MSLVSRIEATDSSVGKRLWVPGSTRRVGYVAGASDKNENRSPMGMYGLSNNSRIDTKRLRSVSCLRYSNVDEVSLLDALPEALDDFLVERRV
jgi:hypothetical protein